MKLDRIWFPLLIILAGLALALIPEGGQAQSQDLSTPQALFEARCSTCHPLEKPLGFRADREEWGKIVNKMRWKSFFKISKDEVEIIADYLSQVRGPLQQ